MTTSSRHETASRVRPSPGAGAGAGGEDGALASALFAPWTGQDMGHEGDLFGRFVGAWDLEWHGDGNDGRPVVVRGDLSVGWVLGGRAIQDVWRVPADPADAGRMRAFHGSTIRFYDPALGAWRSTWLDPLNGRVRRFVGRRDETGGIVLEGLDDDPLERWSFREITADGFRWLGEESVDGGNSWRIVDEMWATRKVSPGYESPRAKTHQATALGVARAYHNAWKNRAYEDAWRLLDQALTVDVPINAYSTKSAFAEAARYTREMASTVTELAEFGGEQEAVLIYDMALPVGNLRIAERFRVDGGRITRIMHIHDTAALRAAAADTSGDAQ